MMIEIVAVAFLTTGGHVCSYELEGDDARSCLDYIARMRAVSFQRPLGAAILVATSSVDREGTEHAWRESTP